jgi:hypothetical protein
MANKLKYLLILLICASVQGVFAQIRNPTYPGKIKETLFIQRDTSKNGKRESQNIDSIRKREENKKDSVVFTSKFIKIPANVYLPIVFNYFP